MTMQDRFKFRAWDSIQEVYEWDIEYCYDGFICCNFGDFLDKSRYIVEQCTGLKDKNDKFIYEGDIIRCSYGNEYYIGLVVWDSEEIQFSMEVDKELYSFSQHSEREKIEVIGNIHENPDLLENKDE